MNARRNYSIRFVWLPVVAVIVLVATATAIANRQSFVVPNSDINHNPKQVSVIAEANGLQRIGLTSGMALPFDNITPEHSQYQNTSADHRTAHRHAANNGGTAQQYQYEKNGISINVKYRVYPPGRAPAINDIGDSVSAQLSQVPGLELIQLTQKPVMQFRLEHQADNRTNSLSHITHSATFVMQPFAKEIHYEVLNVVGNSRHWMISVSYKSCDTKGRKLAKEFLNSLAFVSDGT